MAELTKGSQTRPYSCTGAPTSGTSGTFYGVAQIGAFLVDETSGLWYQNTNTVASPTWSRVMLSTAITAANVLGGAPLVFRFDLEAGALADTDIITTEAIRVIDAFLVLRGAGVSTTTLAVKNLTTAITDAMDASGSDKAIVRAATLDDAQWELAAGGTLRVTSATGASQPAATVYVLAHRV